MSKTLSSLKGLKILAPNKKFLFTPDETSSGPKDIVGMEIELENIPIRTAVDANAAEEYLFPYWKVASDHSLRNNGKEFISCPVFGQDIRQALTVLNKYFSEKKFKPDLSPRAGLHIHMDVGDLSPEELTRLVEVYIIAEPVLYAYCGAGRENNIFCLPWNKTKGVLQTLADFLCSLKVAPEQAIFDYVPTLFKYSGLNIRPIVSYGAMALDDNENNKTGGHIEFRMAPAAYETSTVLTWINILLCLKTYAKSPSKRIPESQEDASALDGLEYFNSIFGYLNDEYMARFKHVLEGANISSLMKEGLRVLTYFKLIKILSAYNKALLVSNQDFLFKSTHPGFTKFKEKVKKNNNDSIVAWVNEAF